MAQHTDHLRKGEDVYVAMSIVAGGLAGLTARSLTAPLDTVKIRLQLLYKSIELDPRIKVNNSILTSMITRMYKKEGILGFWKGNVPGSLMYIIYGATQFGSYTYINSLFSHNHVLNQLPSQVYSTLVGALTGITSSTISYPFDVLRTRFAANQSTRNLRLYATIKDIFRNEGTLGFFRGINSSILAITLSNAIIFGTYESIKIYSEEQLTLLENTSSNSCYVPYKFAYQILNGSAGSLSGLISKLVTYPLDTIRRRIQVSTPHSIHLLAEHKNVYKSYFKMNFIAVGMKIMRDEGKLSLFRGLGINLIKTVPNSAIYLYAYEYFVSQLKN
ncbi:hypothetical protein TPHA_0D03980 [Tetrapisispora phaffii CBS 4417]|uniref:Mitochondrial thiamine pyrophosphate carrier 1 n=1 Tax=Tetrapisispora phaffii (strain ATCC 24235 / CBS 4417 / NBRC 1672 / NRRL Y-8282 / UCD 70-5) TaxID=1071381 RepID=G8BT60_TETPH|nr:hypothetical protein TPHA_0D03980 [Tetrapisispora phaffii CBS 4417]CCE63031.1 hypothetical protein TPHA_0D03980 [Tetrapisispora phaffii CBS 4417]